MNSIEFKFDYDVLENIQECSAEVQELFEKAQNAKDKAYAPYSNFKVGAALVLDNGEIFTGNNQENAAYPSGLCAERVAIFSAKSRYPNVGIKILVIVTSAKNITEPVSPCGSCRQVMVEYEHAQKKPFDIYLQSKEHEVVKLASAKSLLPFSFQADTLHA